MLSDADNRECVFDLAGHCIAEFTNSSGTWSRSEIYALGQSLATYNNGTTYGNRGPRRARFLRTLGWYQPFGDATTCTNPTSRDQYTGYEHDSESGLDHANTDRTREGSPVPTRIGEASILEAHNRSIGMSMR